MGILRFRATLSRVIPRDWQTVRHAMGALRDLVVIVMLLAGIMKGSTSATGEACSSSPSLCRAGQLAASVLTSPPAK